MATLESLRSRYHARLAERVIRKVKSPDHGKTLNCADKSSRASSLIAQRMGENLGLTLGRSAVAGQTAGTAFCEITRDFLDQAFARLRHIRPGSWVFSTSQASHGIGNYEQYEHLLQVQQILNENPSLKTALGGDYLVTPDIVVGRHPLQDKEINAEGEFLRDDDEMAQKSPLRLGRSASALPILHASISCKWTMRSDRAQNTRTEALNLIRNRKGNTPHIMVVTMEPLPTRLASIAMGTGDVDCTYHAALNELKAAIDSLEHEDQAEVLANLIDGRRLRDISDLPFDLAI